MTASRVGRIDTLRGIAVFGIWQINIYACIYGTGPFRFGILDEGAGLVDKLLVFLAAALVEQKFYPIFSFLFGAGFAFQTRGKPVNEAAGTYRRRMRWLLACGILHGTLIWFGDILTVYALVGFWLVRHTGRRLSSIVASLRILLAINIALAVLMAFIYALGTPTDPALVKDAVRDSLAAYNTYTRGSWGAIALLRLEDYAYVLISALFAAPRFALLFLLGVLAVRLGWLTRPQRYGRLWRKVRAVGVGIGLPVNLLGGWFALQGSLAPPAPEWVSFMTGDLAGPLLAGAYVACVMLAGPAALRVLSAWFGAAGRMALTNYLMQSLVLTMLLQGAWLGLGAALPRAAWPLVCLAVMLGQIALSRWWMAHHVQGPLEALWRRHYARPAAGATGASGNGKIRG